MTTSHVFLVFRNRYESMKACGRPEIKNQG